MKRVALFFLLAGIISCSKDDTSTDNTCSNYVKGDVLVGIKNTASMEDAFSLFNGLDLKIDEMSGFFYTSPYPADSLPNLIAYLNTKPYINARGFSANGSYIHYQTGEINIAPLFFDMTINNQKDWISIKKSLKLSAGDAEKNVLIKVTPGTEQSWLKKPKNYNIITWTELNCFAEIIPL